MKTSQVASLFGVGAGLIIIYLAFNSGQRVIVGSLPGGQPIFDHVTNKPMLFFGIVVVVASILAFAFSYRSSPAAAAHPAGGAQTSPPHPPASEDEPADDESPADPEDRISSQETPPPEEPPQEKT